MSSSESTNSRKAPTISFLKQANAAMRRVERQVVAESKMWGLPLVAEPAEPKRPKKRVKPRTKA
jgi:hypothetical protein